MNFLLNNLELSLPEDDLLIGEKLFEDQRISALYESERNLWVAAVDGFEVEIQITPSKVRACSCECSQYLQKKMCGHIAAGLMALRRKVSEKKSQNKRKDRQTYQKLTVNAILEQVGKDELSAFVRYFARSNRQFSIALKTRFASVVPMADNAEKYRQVMDTVLRSARNKNGKISANGSKQLLNTGRDLMGQAKDALALDHYKDTWSVLMVLVEKAFPIVNRTTFETESLLLFIEESFGLLQRLIEHNIPPVLKNEIWTFLGAVVTRPVYRGYNISASFFKILLPLADDTAKLTNLLSLVEKELKLEHLISEVYKKRLLCTKLIILGKRGFKKQAKIFYQEVLLAPDQVLFTVETAYENEMYKLAKELAEKGLKIDQHDLFQYRLKVLLLDIALATNEASDISLWATDCFVASGNIKYLRLSKQFVTGDWSELVQEITHKILDGNPLRKEEYLANLYGEEQMIKDLFNIATANATIEFLMKYDHYFLPDHEKELVELYQAMLDEYFRNHLGVKPTQKMLRLFTHLRKQNAAKVVEKLAAFVRKKHPRRMELAMELMLK